MFVLGGEVSKRRFEGFFCLSQLFTSLELDVEFIGKIDLSVILLGTFLS